MSSRTAGGVNKAGEAQLETGSVISMSSDCNGLSDGDGTGAGRLARVHGEAGGVCFGRIRMPDVKVGVAINDVVRFFRSFQSVSRRFMG